MNNSTEFTYEVNLGGGEIGSTFIRLVGHWKQLPDDHLDVAESPDTRPMNTSTTSEYPEGEGPYSLLGATLTSIPLAIIIFTIVAGNALVIAAVLRDARLQRQVQNWLIVSLAAADMLVGFLIMPLTLTYELLNEWVLGDVLCELWLALDVLFVTASILNLCAISLDRYWSLTQPTVYPHKRTGRRMLIMIVIVWLSAFAISFPPLVGWRPANRAASACYLSTQLGYVLYSSLGSFFIPSLVLLFVYARIFWISRSRSRGKHRSTKVNVKTPLKQSAVAPMQVRKGKMGSGSVSSGSNDNGDVGVKIGINGSQGNGVVQKISMNGAQQKTSFNGPCQKNGLNESYQNNSPNDFCQKKSLHESYQKTSITDPCQRTSFSEPYRKTTMNGQASAKTSLSPEMIFNENDYAVLIAKIRHAALRRSNSLASDTGTLDSGSSSPDRSNRTLSFVPGIASEAVAQSRQSESYAVVNAISLKTQLLQRQKLVRRRERQATLVLGLVLGAFVGCWMPFFCSYFLSALGSRTNPLLFDIVFWLGYCNSALNPFIYNFFNPDFRRAFRNILRKPIDKLRMVIGQSDTLVSSDRRLSSTVSTPGKADRRKSSFFTRNKTKRRGAVFSQRHPYLQIQKHQREALIVFDGADQ